MFFKEENGILFVVSGCTLLIKLDKNLPCNRKNGIPETELRVLKDS